MSSDGPLSEHRPDLAVAPDRLRVDCDESAVAPAAAEAAPEAHTIGQERALAALELGLALRGPGSHVFVSGPDGTGRAAAVADVLARIAPALATPGDRAYVHRFDDADRPRLLMLPAGAGRKLADAVDEFRTELRTRLPALLENRELEHRREAVAQRYAREDDERSAGLRERVAALGMGLVQVAIGPGLAMPDVAPLQDGHPVALEQAEAGLPEPGRKELRGRLEQAQREVHEHVCVTRERQRAFAREIRALVREAAQALVSEELREVREAIPDDAAVAEYLAAIERDAAATAVALSEAPSADLLALRTARYEINVIADRSQLTGAAVLFEDYPSARNLIGTLERVGGGGPFSWVADASTIRAGSLVRADGGFLVLRTGACLSEPGAWAALKRVVLSGTLEPGAASTTLLGLPCSLEPDAIPLDVKLVLIGDRSIHDLLYELDPDFRQLFGVRAEFVNDLPRTPEAVRTFAAVVRAACAREHLLPPKPSALAALVEEASALSGRSDRLTASVEDAMRLVREASYLAAQRAAPEIERCDIDEATRRRQQRDGGLADRLQELALEGTLLIATRGASVGQVNALSVFDLGHTMFGKPTRITASASPGRAGIVNVEREARLSGGVYDKGVMIIGGYLRRLHAGDGPLPLTASLTFEQSYAGVDGDSASIAEVVALMSELSGLPVDNRIAVTGSINQHGEVQPVGAVNEKLRGWHALCAAADDGEHAAIVPATNARTLMLDQEIADACRAGAFRVFAVETVDDALEITLGEPISRIHDAVRSRLRAFARALESVEGSSAVETAAVVAPPPGLAATSPADS